jgi:hypothetical protein
LRLLLLIDLLLGRFLLDLPISTFESRFLLDFVSDLLALLLDRQLAESPPPLVVLDLCFWNNDDVLTLDMDLDFDSSLLTGLIFVLLFGQDNGSRTLFILIGTSTCGFENGTATAIVTLVLAMLFLTF